MVDTALGADRVEGAPRTTTVWAVLATSFGNLIEWYDVYAFSAFSLYFAGAFLPKSDPAVQQLQAATIFAVAFLMRPIGSIVFGYLADRFGRRSSLTVSILAMCFGSALIAVSPTYDSIGIWAAVILSLARVIQGLSQGGEYGTSVTYLSEISPPHQRGFYSGVWYVTLIGGQLCAVLLLFILQKLFLTPDQLRAWGWRIPFALGALASLYGFRMRASLPESEKFIASARQRRPFRDLLRENWRNMLVVIGITVGGTSAFYTYTTYMQKYLKLSVGLSDDQTTAVTLASLIFAIALQPLYGALSDRIGRKPLLVGFGVVGTLGTVPLLTAIRQTHSPLVALLLICAAWAIVSGYTSITAIVKAELFPTAIRALGVGLPYAITAAVFGGSTDAVALAFKDRGFEDGFFWYASTLILVSLIVYLWLPDTRKGSLLDQPS